MNGARNYWSAATFSVISRLSTGLLIAVGLALPRLDALADEEQARQIMALTVESCQTWGKTGEFDAGTSFVAVDQSAIELDGRRIGTNYRFELNSQTLLELGIIDRAGPRTQFISTVYNSAGKAFLFISLYSDCRLRIAKQIVFNDQDQSLMVVSLDSDFAFTDQRDWLNPPLEFIGRGTDDLSTQVVDTNQPPLRVAMVDSGINYRLDEINRRLARDSKGNLIGYDFWDMDELPYDAHPLRSEFFIQRHGTRTASLLLREAPGIELVPYRYPRPDMSRMQALVKHADKYQVAIVGMPLGSNRAGEWLAFEQAAVSHPHILFVVSAGNNGRDIDDQPVYPAALDLDNILVVTSADDFVQPAERTNWGTRSVDYLIPAENVRILDYSGQQINASGSSYAVSRMTALAAKLKMEHQQWTAAEIKIELRKRYSNEHARRWVSSGYIADPLAGNPVLKENFPALDITASETDPGWQLSLNILVLDPVWTHSRIERSVQLAYQILAQCGIGSGNIEIHTINADDYLRDLSTGSARTLLEAAGSRNLSVVFARDTRMMEPFTGEAFGPGNTRSRPWLKNSVWLMPDVGKGGKALAHELFHVIANSGEHVEVTGNLMQSRTLPDNLHLTAAQCRQARDQGSANQILQN